MNRKDFLKGAGLLGLGMTLPKSNSVAAHKKIQEITNACVLVPRETAGPFPLDLSENSTFFRQDIRETETGVILKQKIRVIGVDNCEPMANVRVNIWHCNKDGYYSGYDGNNNPGQQDFTYCRGYQYTDSNGEVEFITILPGWYNGRICHIHFQVYVSSAYAAISQLTYPLDKKNQVYADNPNLYPKGEDPLNFSQDNIFSDGHQYQLATLEDDPDTGGLQSYLEVGVQGSGTSGVGYIEKQMAKVFDLNQNFPNPFKEKTTIPFTLFQSADVGLEIWNLNGSKLGEIAAKPFSAGSHQFNLNRNDWKLSSGNYLYQLVVQSGKDLYRLPKVMMVQ